jgi:hypothetical protein
MGVLERWGTVGATIDLVRHTAIKVELGRLASAPEQLLPATRYASVSLHVAAARRRAPDPSLAGAAAVMRSPTRRVILVRDSLGVSGLRITGVRGSQVELMSDVTNWVAVDLRHAGEAEWVLDRRLAAGVHRILMRVDGGAWEPPPDLPMSRSEYGEQVGILLVME